MTAVTLARLTLGETVEGHKEPGNSMAPLIKHREPVTLAPVDTELLTVDDIVLVKVAGRWYIHLVKAIDGERVQIGNNRGYINGWVKRTNVRAIVTHINGIARSGAADKVK